MKKQTYPHPILMINKKKMADPTDRVVDGADKRKTVVGLCKPANKPNSTPHQTKTISLEKILRFLEDFRFGRQTAIPTKTVS
ncbi:MAG: hypothetical protein ACREDM_14595 [Methylocella sp.]